MLGAPLGAVISFGKVGRGFFGSPTDLASERLLGPRQDVLLRRRLFLPARYSKQ